MNAGVINPFLTACKDAFKRMFNLDAQQNAPYLLNAKSGHPWDISGMLFLLGEDTGIIAVRLHRVLANEMLERSGVRPDVPDERDELVRQMVSEFANVVAGNAITAMPDKNVRVSPPAIITGENHELPWPSGIPIIAIPFVTPRGRFEVDVCFK